MNLLTHPWIEVACRDGERREISPHDIATSDITDIVAPRADFRGAIYQLLIGLLQTAFAPKDLKTWRHYWSSPPDAAALQNAFEPWLPAFNIDAPIGEPAFMQDLTLDEGEDKEIAALFIDAPGGKTLKDNQDHFVKRGRINQLSPISAILALFTLQINAPSGGVGHRVSVRGGGPLTTLILPPEGGEEDTLWKRLWLNVLTRDEMAELAGDTQDTSPERIFPWLALTRTSEKKGTETYPEQAHPLQVYWCMPRRIRLHFPEEQGQCDLTGELSTGLVTGFHTRNYGINYSGHWQHPLTPYVFEGDKEPLSIKAQPGGLGYRHWLGLAVTAQQGKLTRTPALSVRRYEDRQRRISELDFEPRLWAFGYDMDNMKARCWYEAEMPLFNLEQEQREDVVELAKKMIEAASDALKMLKSALKSAWFDRPKDAKGDLSFIDANFWSATEPGFYGGLHELIAAGDNAEAIDEALQRWANILKRQARELFDQYALSSLNEDGDLKRVVQARDGKGGLNHHLNGSRVMKALAA
ncbi:type I-E CRISPR-associated protein Cse1/CasA [Thiolapillus brandeum]|uniref:CRISPR-associated protein CSE1 family n=1 Tax=Thiolapillus brandeum TaxID=1076588 RepID=A0A7U6JIP0_9GAMM|nr:type I-E CRISPR-associated protein Cse1/CasA [Thiolapillus brandeum]BAO44425.1 CRISPR-associated protein CSE1 family [Thiolapillus brandeum]